MFATLFKVRTFNFLHFLMKLRTKCFVLPPLCVQYREKLNKYLLFFQVLLLFFLFVMAFSTTFYLLLDDETVRRCNHYRIGSILITVPFTFFHFFNYYHKKPKQDRGHYIFM